MRRLTGEQYEKFTNALVDAFPSEARMTQMLRFRLDKHLAAIVGGDSLTDIAFNLIGAAEAQGWTDRLIVAARDSNPGNELLLVFAQQFGLAPAAPPRQELERIIHSARGMLDVTQWRERLGEIETRVCRIEIPYGSKTTYGTGFLLGPSVVITNHHVIEPILGKEGSAPVADPKQVILRFDYKRLEDGETLNPGTEHRLADGDTSAWLIDSSPPSPVDGQTDPKTGEPAPTELDYALLRTAGRPGTESVGGRDEPGAPKRGWIAFPAPPKTVADGDALFILQHPQGDPLKLALDTIAGRNANGTRLRYETNTEPGSSGSPCFDINWDLVALHHSGDPGFSPIYNEGIPLAPIAGLLTERGHIGKLGEQPE